MLLTRAMVTASFLQLFLGRRRRGAGSVVRAALLGPAQDAPALHLALRVCCCRWSQDGLARPLSLHPPQGLSRRRRRSVLAFRGRRWVGASPARQSVSTQRVKPVGPRCPPHPAHSALSPPGASGLIKGRRGSLRGEASAGLGGCASLLYDLTHGSRWLVSAPSRALFLGLASGLWNVLEADP